MKKKKYKLDLEDTKQVDGKTLYRIIALKNYTNIKKGCKKVKETYHMREIVGFIIMLVYMIMQQLKIM